VHAWLGRGSRGAAHRWRGVLAVGLPVALYVVGRSVAVGVPGYRADPIWDLGGNPAWGMSLAERLPVAAALAVHYLAVLLWPWPLIAFDVPPQLPTWGDPLSWMGAGLLLLAAVVLVRLLLARRPLALALAWWLASFLVVGQLVVAIGAYREVRFAYGMLGGLAFGVGWLAMRAAAQRTVLVAAGATAAVAMATLVVRRNADFVDLQRLLEADVRQRPASPAALIRLANIHDQGRRDAEAERLLRLVRELAPASAQASYELANFYERRGRRDEALALYEESVARNPSHYISLVALATMAINQGDVDRADALLARAAAVAPDDPWVIYNRAVVDEARGRRERAIASLEALVARRPDFTLAVRGLAQLRAARGY
jgi:tetratricopeptide (TPR) repeat protein